MKKSKVSRAMEHLDEKLVMSAMDDSDFGEKQPRMIVGGNHMKHNAWKLWGSIAAVLVIVLSVVLIFANRQGAAPGAVIALDVNPSMEIEIDHNEKVTKIRALNAEAETVLDGLSLSGKDLNAAVDEIIDSMMEHQYITSAQNSILVSIDADDGALVGALKEKLTGEINARLQNRSINASIITQSFHKNEEQTGDSSISDAKAALIKKIIASGLLDANGVPYSFAVLAKLKINELKLILESKGLEVEGITPSGSASTGNYRSSEEAVATALEKAGWTAQKSEPVYLECEMDYDDDHGVMVYEVEFVYDGLEYEFELSAKDLHILEEESKPAREEAERDHPVTVPENAIAREKALELAYADAGVQAAEVKRPEIELDEEKGNCVYEIEFKAGGMEYEYTLDALTGEILERESEPID